MPYPRYEWHAHIANVASEYGLARLAVDRLRTQSLVEPRILGPEDKARDYLRETDRNLEGTYIVRLFAAFEATLRSLFRGTHPSQTPCPDAATMIDQIGGKRNRGIDAGIRKGAHRVRSVRNYWAHESELDPEPMTINEARGLLQKYVNELPDEW